MSLILEALRKSEAERRRGLPPDLHAELPPAPAGRARAVPAAAWGAAACVLVALLAWWGLRAPATPTQPASEAATSARGASARDEAARAGTGADALPAITPPAAQVAPAAPAETPPAPVAAPVPAPAQDANRDATAASRPAEAPAVAAAQIAAPVPAQPTDAPDPGRPLAVSELDPAVRDALPPLRISMHLWNETPALRFAIIDGQRVTEGEAVGGARIARIERDGVLLQLQGRTIRLPVR